MQTPEPERVYQELNGFLTEVYRFLDKAVAAGRRDLEIRKRPYDVHHFGSMVRNELRNQLADHAKSVDPRLVVNEDLPMNGIDLLYNSYHLKVRKGRDHVTPSAGSEVGRAFMEQRPLFDDEPSELNLVILYDLDDRLSLAAAELLCPNGAGEEAAWWVEIPSPLAATAVAPSTPPTADNLPLEHEEEPVKTEFARGEISKTGA